MAVISVLGHAEVDIEVREAADPRRRPVFDEQQLRHVDRAVLPRDESRRQRHVVELQRIGVISHDRHAVDQCRTAGLRTTWLTTPTGSGWHFDDQILVGDGAERLALALGAVLHEELHHPLVGLLVAIAQRQLPLGLGRALAEREALALVDAVRRRRCSGARWWRA